MTWMQLLAASLGGGGLAGIGGSLLTGLMTRPKVRADAVSLLTDSAIKQVNELQERTAAAENRAAEAERTADDARLKMRLLSDEIDGLLTTMRIWRSSILASSSATDLERLHAMVRVEPGPATNGRRV